MEGEEAGTADERGWTLMEESECYLHSDLSYRVIGCAMTVHRTLGHGLREKSYERALCVEFGEHAISFSQQQSYPVVYRGALIDEYIPDLVVDGRIIVDTKTVDAIIDAHVGQILNYLRVSRLAVGLILNFKHPKLQWKRVVLEA